MDFYNKMVFLFLVVLVDENKGETNTDVKCDLGSRKYMQYVSIKLIYKKDTIKIIHYQKHISYNLFALLFMNNKTGNKKCQIIFKH